MGDIDGKIIEQLKTIEVLLAGGIGERLHTFKFATGSVRAQLVEPS